MDKYIAARQIVVKILAIIGLYAFISGPVVGQDMIFSQYYAAPMHVNPAFAGLNNYPTFNINYRYQWPSLNSVYKTYAASYDQFFKSFNSGLGLILLSDDQGDGTLKTTQIEGIYSYNVRFRDDWQIRFGLKAGYIQNSLDWDKLIFFDQIDIERGPFDSAGTPFPSTEQQPANLSNGALDISFGMMVYNPAYYIGFGLDHINGAYTGFLQEIDDGTRQGLPLLFSLVAGSQIIISEDNKGNPSSFISPNVIFAHQSGFTQVNAGAYLQVNELFGGAWLRHTLENIDAFIFSFGVNFKNTKIAYSFDLTSSNLGIQTGGSHEIAISIGLRHLEKKESKYNDCFSLFR